MKIKKKWGRIYAWIVTVAMLLSMINMPITAVQAATTQNLTVKSGATGVTIAKNQYGDDYIGDLFFNIPDVLKTKSNISSNKVTSMQVKLTIKSFTQGSGDKAQAFIFAQPDATGSWNWNQSATAELAVNKQITLNYSFADMDWNGGTTMGNLGVRFANAADGSTVSYSVDSAVINLESGSAATSQPSTTASAGGNVSTDQIAISMSVGSGANEYYGEYSFTITNNSSSTVTGIQILLPTSQEVSVGYVNGYDATYDAEKGGIVIYYSAELGAGQTVSGSDNKVGFSKDPSTTVGQPSVIAVNCSAPSGGNAGLQYALNGRQDLAYKDTPVGKHGKLAVKAVDGYTAPILTDESGAPVQLRGASTHGMHWFPQYINKSAFHTLRDDWGVNLMRLVCYPRDTGSVGYLTGGDSTKQQLDSLIQNGVQYATELGMYAIVDWHVHAYNPNEYLQEAKTFFTKYATMYKDQNNVLYEICNEPTDTSWYSGNGNDLYTYCKEIIQTIRAIDSDAIIICGTNTWSQDVDEVAAHPMKDLGYENIMYTAHFYAATHYSGLMDKVRKATNDGTPVFVTEFGVCSADGNGKYDTANADKWVALMDELNISMACWSYSNCNEKSAYFVNSCSNSQGDWTAGDLTTTGKWLINTYRAHKEAEDNPGGTDKPTASSQPSSNPGATDAPQGSSNPNVTSGPQKSSQPNVTNTPQDGHQPGNSKDTQTSAKPGNTGKQDQNGSDAGGAVIGGKAGTKIETGMLVYKITKAATTQKPGMLQVAGLSKKGKKAAKLSFPATATIGKAHYQVTSVGKNALEGAKVKQIAMGKNLTRIEKGAFKNCKKLQKLTIKGKLKTVQKGAFSGCKKRITIKGASKKIRKANVKKLKKSGYKRIK